MIRTKTQHDINREIYLAMSKLGAEPELLTIIGSLGDTLGDDEVLAMLKKYNAGNGFPETSKN